MSENRIQQVLEIEKQAQQMHDTALAEAQQLPVQAEKEAQAILEKARAEAEEEARKILSRAQADEETRRILVQAEEKNRQLEALAMSNFGRAVAFILDRVTGRA
jgi:V/A-type H+-transporting ATPase subunit G/H